MSGSLTLGPKPAVDLLWTVMLMLLMLLLMLLMLMMLATASIA